MIRVGRILVNVFVFVNLILVTSLYIVKRLTLSSGERKVFFDSASIGNAWAFFVMFLLLAIVISVLIYFIRIKDRHSKNENSVFKQEKVALSITLVVFSISYLVRWIWDLKLVM